VLVLKPRVGLGLEAWSVGYLSPDYITGQYAAFIVKNKASIFGSSLRNVARM